MQISFVAAAGGPAGPVPRVGSGGGVDAAPESFASLLQKAGTGSDKATPQKRTDLADTIDAAAGDLAESVADGTVPSEVTVTPAAAIVPAPPAPADTGAGPGPVPVEKIVGAMPAAAVEIAAPAVAVIGQAGAPLAMSQDVVATAEMLRSSGLATVLPSGTPQPPTEAAPRPSIAASVKEVVPVRTTAPVIPATASVGVDLPTRSPAPEPVSGLPPAETVGMARGAVPQVAIAAGAVQPRSGKGGAAPSVETDQMQGAAEEIVAPRMKDAGRDTLVAATAGEMAQEPSRQRAGPAMTPDPAGPAGRQADPAGLAGRLSESASGLPSETGLHPVHQMRETASGLFPATEGAPLRPQTPLLAQHVAQQLAVSLRQTSDRMTELALDPVELGKVRMTVRAQDQTIVMTVLADRPETADLMRRHAEILQQEFRALGYTSVTLDVSAGQGQSASTGSGHGGAGQTHDADPGADRMTAEDAAPIVTARQADGSLDLRL